MDSAKPGVLSWRETARRRLDFNAGEDGHALANHVGCDGDGAPADQVSGATGEAKLNGPAGAWIWELADLITEKAQIGACAKCEADALLDIGLSVGHARDRSDMPSQESSRVPWLGRAAGGGCGPGPALDVWHGWHYGSTPATPQPTAGSCAI